MTALYLYDDARARQFEPFALTRPVSELRAGAEIIRARWERAVGTRAEGFIGAPHLAAFDESGAARAFTGDTIPAGAIVASSRCVVALDTVLHESDVCWKVDGRIAAVRVARDLPAQSLADGSAVLEDLCAGAGSAITGRWIEAIWDLIATLAAQLAEDIPLAARGLRAATTDRDVIGLNSVTIEDGAVIEPYVVFDASAGPILVRRGAHVSAFTRIVGPCYIGEHATIVGDRVANCSIGDVSKIRGEISSSIVLGHSNKGHTGFVGHSYLGRWVNLGSGTTTSNLKNTYGTVQLWTPSGFADTGQQFLGTMFGDHSKTGIGTMLTTGTVLGAGANVFGSSLHPKSVPPFAWGDRAPYSTFEPSKFLDVAERVMRRRDVALSGAQRTQLAAAFDKSRDSRE